MPKLPHVTTTTTLRTSLEIDHPDRLSLLILEEGSSVAHPLPEAGDIIVGRSERCDVRIDSPSISRQHALLRMGTTLSVQDLGSANGTHVRGRRLKGQESAELSLNETALLGSVLVVVQRRSAPMRSRRLWGHDYFEGRVAEECARAHHSGRAFSILHLRLAPDTPATTVPQAFNDVLRQVDVAGTYSPGEYDVLLIDATAQEAGLATGRLATLLKKSGSPTDIGLATYPADGTSADALLSSARRRALGDNKTNGGGRIVVEDPAMQHLHRLVERVATGVINVLILGETGTGKQVVAEQVHKCSPRAQKPFLQLNCSALSETLLESELFGHERGAFTGAVQAKPGLLETANGGTVFLDEIGDMSPAVQVKLLHLVQEHTLGFFAQPHKKVYSKELPPRQVTEVAVHTGF